MFRLTLTALAAVAVLGCGHTPSRLGVATNEIGVTKQRDGAPATGATNPEFLPGTLTRAKHVDVLGDDRPELLVLDPREKHLQVRDQSGAVLRTVRTTDYLTDFDGITAGDPPKKLLVIYTYPNPTRGGTFEVLENAERTVASWDETPPPGRFFSGRWHDRAALYYLRDDDLVVRSETGALLATLRVPEGRMFRELFVENLRDGLLAVVASGSGYTPYHMVCFFDGDRLVYRDVDDHRAWATETADGRSTLIVTTDTDRWKYAAPRR